ncbi:uncharacterized protein BDR25DRAFT_360577 [Lindgomyces ingoldianus]|uniref:Uncharacterized protein n=1 Tax=Lindgomyces ingoldianus TaxID=673940 RepID=A0ACB6QFJ6_9PLEO|nr:uncharacterized protein BDR25DRAFT_360577 [Lindgomyces ingoldianus]KAF2465645.1 hypothetical protein BDR25DRAFT_360577 [Lindgomyces ingoldianus]
MRYAANRNRWRPSKVPTSLSEFSKTARLQKRMPSRQWKHTALEHILLQAACIAAEQTRLKSKKNGVSVDIESPGGLGQNRHRWFPREPLIDCLLEALHYVSSIFKSNTHQVEVVSTSSFQMCFRYINTTIGSATPEPVTVSGFSIALCKAFGNSNAKNQYLTARSEQDVVPNAADQQLFPQFPCIHPSLNGLRNDSICANWLCIEQTIINTDLSTHASRGIRTTIATTRATDTLDIKRSTPRVNNADLYPQRRPFSTTFNQCPFCSVTNLNPAIIQTFLPRQTLPHPSP